MIVAFLAALIGGFGHAATMGQGIQLGMVALAGGVTAAALLFAAPARRLGVGALVVILGANQVLVHQLCMWRAHAEETAASMAPHMHVHMVQEPSSVRMLIVHALALLVGIVVLVRAERLLWRMSARMVARILVRVRGAQGARSVRRVRAVVLLGMRVVARGRTRVDVWSSQVIGRRGPPVACAMH